MSLYTKLFHDVDPPSTLENASVSVDELPDEASEAAGEPPTIVDEETEDAAYYQRLMASLKLGQERLEKAGAETRPA
jgi:hypothetical protein